MLISRRFTASLPQQNAAFCIHPGPPLRSLPAHLAQLSLKRTILDTLSLSNAHISSYLEIWLRMTFQKACQVQVSGTQLPVLSSTTHFPTHTPAASLYMWHKACDGLQKGLQSAGYPGHNCPCFLTSASQFNVTGVQSNPYDIARWTKRRQYRAQQVRKQTQLTVRAPVEEIRKRCELGSRILRLQGID